MNTNSLNLLQSNANLSSLNVVGSNGINSGLQVMNTNLINRQNGYMMHYQPSLGNGQVMVNPSQVVVQSPVLMSQPYQSQQVILQRGVNGQLFLPQNYGNGFI